MLGVLRPSTCPTSSAWCLPTVSQGNLADQGPAAAHDLRFQKNWSNLDYVTRSKCVLIVWSTELDRDGFNSTVCCLVFLFVKVITQEASIQHSALPAHQWDERYWVTGCLCQQPASRCLTYQYLFSHTMICPVTMVPLHLSLSIAICRDYRLHGAAFLDSHRATVWYKNQNVTCMHSPFLSDASTSPQWPCATTHIIVRGWCSLLTRSFDLVCSCRAFSCSAAPWWYLLRSWVLTRAYCNMSFAGFKIWAAWSDRTTASC